MRRILQATTQSFLAVACVILLCAAGCGREETEQRPKSRTDEVQRLEEQVRCQEAENQRLKTERETAEKEKEKWQTLSGWLTAGAVILLVGGMILGSEARKNAKRQRGTEMFPGPDTAESELANGLAPSGDDLGKTGFRGPLPGA